MLPQELGLISQLAGQKQQQKAQKVKAEPQMLQNGHVVQQQRMHQQHSTDSVDSGGSEREGAVTDATPRQSPTALLNNLLATSRGNGHQQHTVGLHSNGTLSTQQLDFANAVQLANYAGHFPEEMSNLFGNGQPAAQQFVYPPQPAQPTATIATTGRRHRSSDMIKCSFCPKKLHGQAALQAHLEDCRQIRIHECAQCGKRFKARGGLQQHNRIHINDRPYHCHFCPKRFTQKSHVDQHERIHTGAKPFACQFCGRQFRQRSQQMGHEATHLTRERIAAVANGVEMPPMNSNAGMVGVNGGGGGERSSTSNPRNSLSSSQSSPISEMAPMNGHQLALQHHQEQQRQILAAQQNPHFLGCQPTTGGNASLAIAAAAAQQQMAFNGLLRAVGSGEANGQFQQQADNMAVDSLLAMSSIKQQQPTGADSELNERLRMMGR